MLTPSTFSIVALDPDANELGVAVESKFLSVGSAVPWVEAGVGAIATQSWANTTYGPRGLDLLRKGATPEETIRTLTGDDEHADERQVGIVDANGRSATYTGAKCKDWAGGKSGLNFAAQGNILVGQAVVDSMVSTVPPNQGPPRGPAGRRVARGSGCRRRQAWPAKRRPLHRKAGAAVMPVSMTAMSIYGSMITLSQLKNSRGSSRFTSSIRSSRYPTRSCHRRQARRTAC